MLLTIGLVAVALGILGIVYGIFQKVKAGRVTDAPFVPTGDIARRGREACGPKGQISAQGNVGCQQPLVSPFTGQQCLFYTIKCTARWKDGDTNKSEVIDEQKHAAAFSIDDGSGPVWVDAREGGDFSPAVSKSETKGTGILGGLTGTEIAFGNYRVNTPMLDVGTKYEVEEEILPLVPRMYACGKLADDGSAITAPNWRQLILSEKTRDELLSSASKTAKISLIIGAVALVSGSGMAIAGEVMSGKEEPEKPPPATSTTAAPSVSTPVAPASTTAVPIINSGGSAGTGTAAAPTKSVPTKHHPPPPHKPKKK